MSWTTAWDSMTKYTTVWLKDCLILKCWSRSKTRKSLMRLSLLLHILSKMSGTCRPATIVILWSWLFQIFSNSTVKTKIIWILASKTSSIKVSNLKVIAWREIGFLTGLSLRQTYKMKWIGVATIKSVFTLSWDGFNTKWTRWNKAQFKRKIKRRKIRRKTTTCWV